MGKANKARRAAKRRDRQRSGHHHHNHQPPWGPRAQAGGAARCEFDEETALLRAAECAAHKAPLIHAFLGPLTRARPARVARTLAGLLERWVKRAWDNGWQPADLDWAAGRDVEPVLQRLVAQAIRSESRHYAAFGRDVAPEWMAQVDALAAGSAPPPAGNDPWPQRWAAAEQLPWADAVTAGVEALGYLMTLPRIPPVGLPPRSWQRGSATVGHVKRAGADDKVLARVRALLATAEATDFTEEAAAFTAKAQELMTRHRIDRLMLADPETADDVAGCRISTDDPYAGAKALLLDSVARANGCRAVWSQRHGFGTVFGRAADLESVELLFTSLLVQATTAMTVAGTDRRTRSRSFRQSFLAGFATRVEHRLQEGMRAATDEAEAAHGTCLLPVLARNDKDVEDAVHEACPELTSHSVGANDDSGWSAGLVAGQLADLAAPRLPLEAV